MSALVALFLVPACGLGATGKVVWPIVAHCAPNPADIFNDVINILQQGSGGSIGPEAVAALDQLAAKYTPDVVACVVNTLVSDWSHSAAARDLSAAARGRDFLHKKGVERTVIAPVAN